jgi:hypothetical protein
MVYVDPEGGVGFHSQPYTPTPAAVAKGKSKNQQLADLFNQAYSEHGFDFSQALLAHKKGLAAIDKGFLAALANASQGAFASKQQALSQGQQSSANVQQMLGQRGLGNTTLAPQALSQSAALTSKSAAEIDQGLAQIMSQLHAQKGLATLGAQQGIAGLYGGKQSSSQNLLGMQLQAMFNKGKSGGGSGTAELFGTALAAIAFSDRRLKRDVIPLGHGVYEFSYLWDDERHVGVMAQEHPEARILHPSGFWMVDYSKVRLR